MNRRLCWLASYPKSGNTWMRLALISLRQGGAAVDINGNKLLDAAAYDRFRFDTALEVESSCLSAREIDDARPAAYRALAVELAEPTVAKVHEAFLRTGDGQPAFPPDITRGAVLMVRDPRDVAPSLAAHLGTSIDRAIAAMNDPGFTMGSNAQLPQRVGTWSSHAASWLDQTEMPVTLIRYEDMLADPAAQLARAAAAFGFDAPPETLAGAVAATRFERLSDQEQSRGFRERSRSAQAPFFRQGRAGAWRTTLGPDQAARIEADHGAMMARLGYE